MFFFLILLVLLSAYVKIFSVSLMHDFFPLIVSHICGNCENIFNFAQSFVGGMGEGCGALNMEIPCPFFWEENPALTLVVAGSVVNGAYPI